MEPVLDNPPSKKDSFVITVILFLWCVSLNMMKTSTRICHYNVFTSHLQPDALGTWQITLVLIKGYNYHGNHGSNSYTILEIDEYRFQFCLNIIIMSSPFKITHEMYKIEAEPIFPWTGGRGGALSISTILLFSQHYCTNSIGYQSDSRKGVCIFSTMIWMVIQQIWFSLSSIFPK